jgi:hypothetical protein
MTAPDQVACQLFIQANSRAGGSNVVFESWASDTDTFQPNPQFPIDSIEVKANWMTVSDIPGFTNNRVTLAQVPQLYHVNSTGGVQYALVARGYDEHYRVSGF